MSASQRRSRSRNTTPASVSGFSADTFLSHEGGLAGGPTYQELITAHGTTDPTSIPSSASLADLRNGLRTMQETVKARSLACERRLRELHNKIELDRPEAQNDPETERLRRGLDDIDRKDKLVKRTKKQKDADNKRPPAVGAHQATGQGMANDTVAQSECTLLGRPCAASPASFLPAPRTPNHSPPYNLGSAMFPATFALLRCLHTISGYHLPLHVLLLHIVSLSASQLACPAPAMECLLTINRRET